MLEILRARACPHLCTMWLPDWERSVCSQFNGSKASVPSQFVCKDLNENSNIVFLRSDQSALALRVQTSSIVCLLLL